MKTPKPDYNIENLIACEQSTALNSYFEAILQENKLDYFKSQKDNYRARYDINYIGANKQPMDNYYFTDDDFKKALALYMVVKRNVS